MYYLVKKERNTVYLHSSGSKLTPRGLHSRGTRNINAILILKIQYHIVNLNLERLGSSRT